MTELYTDGGARGNPGPAAIGGVATRDGEPLFEFAITIGEATNNQAEYRAIITGLSRLREEGETTVSCYLDSELVVRQLEGRYRVKNPDLKPLFEEARRLMEEFDEVSVEHVPRAQNAVADGLVNRALDGASLE